MEESGKEKKKRTQCDYNLAFKLAVISQVEKGELTYKQAQKLYGIQWKSTVLVWLRKHGTLNWQHPKDHSMKTPKETPAQKIKRLEKELEDERLKNLILNEMIDLSDEQYGTSIRKKYLPKQSEGSRPKKD